MAPYEGVPLDMHVESISHRQVGDLLEKVMAPTPVLLPGKSHGRRSLVGCSPRGR